MSKKKINASLKKEEEELQMSLKTLKKANGVQVGIKAK